MRLKLYDISKTHRSTTHPCLESHFGSFTPTEIVKAMKDSLVTCREMSRNRTTQEK